MPSSFLIKRSPFLGWEKMSVRSFLLFENHTKLFRVTQARSAAECHLLPSIKDVRCFKRKSSQHDFNVACLKCSLKSSSQGWMEHAGNGYYLPHIYKEEINQHKDLLTVFRFCFKEPFNVSLKSAFILQLPTTIALIFFLYCYIQLSFAEVVLLNFGLSKIYNWVEYQKLRLPQTVYPKLVHTQNSKMQILPPIQFWWFKSIFPPVCWDWLALVCESWLLNF